MSLHPSHRADEPTDLASSLNNKDWRVRQRTRQSLFARGHAATPMLVPLLQSDSDDVRWEAARVLKELADPASIPALLDALEDGNGSVRWIAAETLIAIGKRSYVPLFRYLLQHPSSIWVEDAVYHITHALPIPEVEPVRKALEENFAAVAVLPAVAEALRKLEE